MFRPKANKNERRGGGGGRSKKCLLFSKKRLLFGGLLSLYVFYIFLEGVGGDQNKKFSIRTGEEGGGGGLSKNEQEQTGGGGGGGGGKFERTYFLNAPIPERAKGYNLDPNIDD